jgi:hypothetical protein
MRLVVRQVVRLAAWPVAQLSAQRVFVEHAAELIAQLLVFVDFRVHVFIFAEFWSGWLSPPSPFLYIQIWILCGEVTVNTVRRKHPRASREAWGGLLNYSQLR